MRREGTYAHRTRTAELKGTREDPTRPARGAVDLGAAVEPNSLAGVRDLDCARHHDVRADGRPSR